MIDIENTPITRIAAIVILDDRFMNYHFLYSIKNDPTICS